MQPHAHKTVTSREAKKETSTCYYRARYYDQTSGRFVTEDPTGFHGGIDFYRYVGNGATNQVDPFGLSSLTPEQCHELQQVLNLEKKYGTWWASQSANINYPFGPGLLHDFNSSPDDYQPVPTALGPVNLDWFSTLSAAGIPGTLGRVILPPFITYGFYKSAWIGIRLVYPHAPPVSNNLPYKAPDERRAAFLLTIGVGYRDLFPPDWMKKNCPLECGLK
jgi:RHS repeat-associated protein